MMSKPEYIHFVIKNNRTSKNRRQFLIIEGKTILAFPPQGKGFPECPSFTEVTDKIKCKVCFIIYIMKFMIILSINY